MLGFTGIPISLTGLSITLVAASADAIDQRPRRPDPSAEITFRF
jgi:hypothetical protein